jgi:hypothetical protein
VDFLIEIVVIAAAAYGVKSYFFTPESLKNPEAFSSRGAIFVKRVVNEQILARRELNNNIATQSPEQLTTEEGVNAPVAAKETTATPKTAEIVKPQVTEQPIAKPQPETVASLIPEDSVLKRHFLAQLTAEQASIKNPHPTDSVLRRHYEQIQISSLTTNHINTETAAASAPVVAETANQTESETHSPFITIPEDSVLKRHHNQLIQSRMDA